MAKSSKKRARSAEDGAADESVNAVAEPQQAPAVKKSKINANGKAEVTKNGDEEVVKAKKEKKEKKGKEEKKSKSKDVDSAGDDDEPTPAPFVAAPEQIVLETPAEEKKPKKEKKDKKDKSKKSKTTGELSADAQPEGETNGEDEDEDAEAASGKPARFICFIGNLPYTATKESVGAHFATVHPINVRLLTQRDDPKKSRGIAFVEFGRFDHMKTCLEKFHHTDFDDGLSPVRKINVELTAGGGGKTSKRQEKIATKNKKLNEERTTRAANQETAKAEKAKGKPEAGAEEPAVEGEAPVEAVFIHPSRLGRVPHNMQTQEQRDEDAKKNPDQPEFNGGGGRKFGGGGGRFRGRGGGRGGGGRGRGR
ncbi:hypothetical protein B0H67DRAFT_526001 [Lasiosphaeris hirsuta]|uniref:RRM domain-containing protein n=1 Tax=Lasiosphaeris hirsuta TaxID=260670 RepID=A0AA40B8Q8_9PEZI|nr:hypothetical protein B0H67DRAFT_526001 [Lasiosphaeris hirsuta]